MDELKYYKLLMGLSTLLNTSRLSSLDSVSLLQDDQSRGHYIQTHFNCSQLFLFAGDLKSSYLLFTFINNTTKCIWSARKHEEEPIKSFQWHRNAYKRHDMNSRKFVGMSAVRLRAHIRAKVSSYGTRYELRKHSNGDIIILNGDVYPAEPDMIKICDLHKPSRSTEICRRKRWAHSLA